MNRAEQIRTPPRRLRRIDRHASGSPYPMLAGIGSGLVESYRDSADDRLPDRLLRLLERLDRRSPSDG
jgi:hypothetical protein